MEQKEYNRTLEKDLVGRKVITIQNLTNGLIRIPKGTVCEINRKSGGFTLVSDPCPCCGVRVSITHVPPHAVDPFQKTQQDDPRQLVLESLELSKEFFEEMGCARTVQTKIRYDMVCEALDYIKGRLV